MRIVILFLLFFNFSLFANEKIKPFLGVSYQAVFLADILPSEKNKNKYAIRILHILPETAAAKSGLQRGDLILQVDKQEFIKKSKNENREFFKEQITSKKIGQKLELQIVRFEEKYRLEDRVLGEKEWLEYIQKQEYNKNINLQFQKNTTILNFSIQLGANPFREETTDINTHFFDFYGSGKEQAILLKEVSAKYDLQASTDELINVFIEDQKTDYGCRMPAVRFLHHYPEKLLPTIDQTTRKIYQSFHKQKLPSFLEQVVGLLEQSDVTKKLPAFPKNNNWQQHLQYIQEIFQIAQKLENKAFAALSVQEKNQAREYFQLAQKELVNSFGLAYGSELSQKSYNIRLTAQKIDFLALLQSAWVLSHFSNSQWHAFLKKALFTLPQNSYKHQEVKGDILWLTKENNFSLVVGSSKPNSYTGDFSMIVDLGGADYYTTKKQGSKIILDLAGNDFYSSTKNYSQAAAFFGIKLLIDLEGDDNYNAQNFSQASAVFGVGILYDMAGNDFYKSNGFSQGYAFYGLGILVDNEGDDEYASDIFSQAVGSCRGLGLLLDVAGNDKYRAGLQQASTYRVAGSFHGASQGFGFGIRGYFDGGIGLLLDGKGKDIFQAGNFSQGSGYFFGLGVLKNFGKEADSYIAYRYGQASAAHSALGVLIDDGGNDLYRGQVAAVQSAAWDKSVTAFWDKKGDDRYISLNAAFSLAAAAHNGYAYFLDSAGKDSYQVKNFRSTTQNSYHGGSSLSFFFDLGGAEDNYEQKNIQNHSTWKKRTTQIFWDR